VAHLTAKAKGTDMKKTMRLTVSAALLAAALLAGVASAAPSLDEAFDLLAAYQFGQDRSALVRVRAARSWAHW